MKENLTLRLRIKLKDGKLADKVDLNLKYRKRGADAVPSDGEGEAWYVGAGRDGGEAG